MSDTVNTIKIRDLLETTALKNDDQFVVDDGTNTYRISGEKLISLLQSKVEENGSYISKSSIGVANGVTPLNSNTKISSTYLSFGTETGTVYDGGNGQILKENLNTHIADNAVHHSHSNKNVLDSITATKISQWDNAASGSSGVTSLTDLGVSATAAELNYMSGVTSNVQTQLNSKAASSHGTHVSYSTTVPNMNGTASTGSASTVARSDHTHPTDTSRAAVSHTHAASNITAGTLGGQIVAPADTSYETNKVRNGVLTSTDPGVGAESSYVNGTIIYVYE